MKKPRIPLVFDTKNPQRGVIPVSIFNAYYKLHELQDIRINRTNDYVCEGCKEAVKLHAKPIKSVSVSVFEKDDHSYHFQHPSGTGLNCDWKTGSKTLAQIYHGIQEGKKHRELKLLIANTIAKLDDWVIDIDTIDSYFLYSPDKRLKGKPDVHAFRAKDEYVFEIQLRSEKVDTINKRKKLYKSSNRKLIWISAENSEIVSEQYSDNCLDMTQVQKDIAFSNRGNLLIFDQSLAEKSAQEGKLFFLVIYYHPRIQNRVIQYEWRSKFISIDELTFDNGEAFYSDFYKKNEQVKAKLRTEGQKAVEQALQTEFVTNFGEFVELVNREWASVDQTLDEKWLTNTYRKDREQRELRLKRTVVNFFSSPRWRKKDENRLKGDLNKFHSFKSFNSKLIAKTEKYDFGFHDELDPYILDKLLIILGYNLSEHLNINKNSHCVSVHQFLDHDTHTPYLNTCFKAIELSPYNLDIMNNLKNRKEGQKNIDDLYHSLSIIEPDTTHDTFLKWFTSEPKLEPIEQ